MSIANELLTPEELEELQSKLKSLETVVNTGITTDSYYTITYRSILLARKEGRLIKQPGIIYIIL